MILQEQARVSNEKNLLCLDQVKLIGAFRIGIARHYNKETTCAGKFGSRYESRFDYQPAIQGGEFTDLRRLVIEPSTKDTAKTSTSQNSSHFKI